MCTANLPVVPAQESSGDLQLVIADGGVAIGEVNAQPSSRRSMRRGNAVSDTPERIGRSVDGYPDLIAVEQDVERVAQLPSRLRIKKDDEEAQLANVVETRGRATVFYEHLFELDDDVSQGNSRPAADDVLGRWAIMMKNGLANLPRKAQQVTHRSIEAVKQASITVWSLVPGVFSRPHPFRKSAQPV